MSEHYKIQIITMKLISLILGVAILAGCASKPTDPALFSRAEAAIKRAVDAGAEEHAPVELRFAMERLQFAQQVASEREDYELAGWRAQEAELNAELAYVKTQAELARAEEDTALRAVEQVQEDIRVEFGEEGLE